MARDFVTEPSQAEPKVSALRASVSRAGQAAAGQDLLYVLHGWRDRLVPKDEWDTSDQYTTLKWTFIERRDGEIAVYECAGLWARVDDLDGDCSEWRIRRGRGGPILAEGNRYDGNHFFTCLHDAEAALRRIIVERVKELRGAAQETEAEGRDRQGSVHEGSVAEGHAPI